MIKSDASITCRWPFLTSVGFKHFSEGPIYQGYEVLSRHPFFPASKYGVGKGEEGQRPAWDDLSPQGQSSFLFDYKFALSRMRLHVNAWVGSETITFDCTEDSTSIAEAIRYHGKLAIASGRLKINGSDAAAIKTKRDALKGIGWSKMTVTKVHQSPYIAGQEHGPLCRPLRMLLERVS